MSEICTKASTQGGQAGSLPICHDRLRPLPVRRGDYVRKLRGVATTARRGKSTKNVYAVGLAGISQVPIGTYLSGHPS
jgi:hypothetical protein